MLKDESGEISPIKLDSIHVNSDNALIVLDEYSDVCWVWIGRNVSMPTRMHTLRMGRSIKRSGYKIGPTTIGLGIADFIEMREKNDDNPEVAANIDKFRDAISGSWAYEDKFLAYKEDYQVIPSGGAATEEPTPPETPSTVEPEEAPMPSEPEDEPLPPEPTTPSPVASPSPTVEPAPEEVAEEEELEEAPAEVGGQVLELSGEEKAALLLYSVVKHSELVYAERIDEEGKNGFKVESPGQLVLTVEIDGNELRMHPSDFGESEISDAIREEYQKWV
jgi:hypothetical protein